MCGVTARWGANAILAIMSVSRLYNPVGIGRNLGSTALPDPLLCSWRNLKRLALFSIQDSNVRLGMLESNSRCGWESTPAVHMAQLYVFLCFLC